MSDAPRSGGADEGGGPSVRWKLTVAYDGSGFHGFAAQEGQRTVAGCLAGALGAITRGPVSLTCAGRTDAGVHALDQVVHFEVPSTVSAGLDPAAVVKSCNSQLGPAIVVRAVPVSDGVTPPGVGGRAHTSSMRAIGALSPWRLPSFKMRV